MSSTVAHSEVFGACRVLFGDDTRVDPHFLAGLDLATIRRHFRRRAIAAHPDRAAILRRSPAALVEAFQQIEGAYRILRAYVTAGKPPVAIAGGTTDRAPFAPASRAAPAAEPGAGPDFAGGRPPTVGGPRPGAPVDDHRWTGPIPSRTLRLGEYLYYSGHITWRELIRALVWQSRQRPPFGQVATRLGFLTPELLARVLRDRNTQERIGEAALRLRLMSSREQAVVLQAQQCGSRRLGDYFVVAGLFRSTEIERFGRGVRAHNARVTCAGAA